MLLTGIYFVIFLKSNFVSIINIKAVSSREWLFYEMLLKINFHVTLAVIANILEGFAEYCSLREISSVHILNISFHNLFGDCNQLVYWCTDSHIFLGFAIQKSIF